MNIGVPVAPVPERPNNSMQRTAPRAAADAGRSAARRMGRGREPSCSAAWAATSYSSISVVGLIRRGPSDG
jgi:hypothetical protein